jgi:transposase
MKAYSVDLRTRLVRAVAQGMPKPQVAQVFGVSARTINRYLRQQHATGTLAAKPIPGRPRAIPTAQQAALTAQVQANPDATLAEHCRTWEQAHGQRVSVATMARALRRLGWPRKKEPDRHRT